MRKYLLFILLTIIAMRMFAQTRILGTVIDQKSGVKGASVTLKGFYDGAVTDSTGRFSFQTAEKGEQVLLISAVGYRAAVQKLLLDGTTRELIILLKEEVNELKAVVIAAGSFEASDKKKASVLSPVDILTTASANADVTGAIKTLPGTQQVGESEGLFVRGGTSSETRTYMDGNLVNHFFYSSVPSISQRGRFSPWMLKGTVFSAGGYSALYGGALSSAVILETLDLPERSSGNISLSPISASGSYQKLSKNHKASWGMSYGYMNLHLAYKVLNTVPEYFQIPGFHTVDGHFRIRTSTTGILKYYGYLSSNKIGVRSNSIDSIGFKEAFYLNNRNVYHNLFWREALGNQWKLNTGISYTNNRDNISGSFQNQDNVEEVITGFEYKKFDIDARGDYLNSKAVFEKRFKGLTALRFGAEYNFSDDRSHYTRYDGTAYLARVKEHLVAGFAETDIYVTNQLAAKLGGRMERSQLMQKFNWAPRISLAYKLGTYSQASLAYGIFHQNPEKKYLPSIQSLNFAKATHYIVQYQKMTTSQIFRLEVYYKKYQNLLKTGFVDRIERAQSGNGRGYAKGFELFYRDKSSIKNVDYWITYSYLDTRRDFLNYPGLMEPSFASKHTGNFVMKRFFSKLKTQFNANYAFATGRPYYNIRYDNSSSKFNIYDRGRTKPFNSLSLSVNYLPNIYKSGAGKYTVFVFSVTNALGANQVFGYRYSYDGYRKEAIIPPTKTFVYIGAFISFGVDRSQDAINNHL